MGTAAQGFPRANRLRRGSEFRAVAQRGRRVAGPCFVVVAAPTLRGPGEREPRLGLTVSRRIGGAVVRNRVKRRIREWFRTGTDEVLGGLDLVVIARRGAGKLSGREVARCLSALAADVAGLRG